MSITFDPAKYTLLAEGGEGQVFEYGTDQVIKVYKSGVDLAAKERKVNALLSLSLPAEVVSPNDIALDRHGRFIGYSMQRVEGEDFKRLANKKYVVSNRITRKDVLSMLVRLQSVMNALHQQGIYIGDLNDQNVIFDKRHNIHLIDCDSWSIGSDHCQVAMDLFRDPKLTGDQFNQSTDWYAFCVLAWKSLTRIHPFGGTMNPDVPIIDRMTQGLSVLCGKPIKLPRTVHDWTGLSPELIDMFHRVFDKGDRTESAALDGMFNKLSYCKTHKEYYYSGFNRCPLCDNTASVKIKPESRGTQDGFLITAMFLTGVVASVLSRNVILGTDGLVSSLKAGTKIPMQQGLRYHFLKSGTVITEDDRWISFKTNTDYRIEKRYKSYAVLDNDTLYFIDTRNSLTKMTVMDRGNGLTHICKCSTRAMFEVRAGHYCVVNLYDGKLIFNIDGFTSEVRHSDSVIDYGIHYDTKSDQWLFAAVNSAGCHRTMILKKNHVVWDSDSLSYKCRPDCLCFYAGSIFIPIDGSIRGFSHSNMAYKDFTCDVVDPSSSLERTGNKFIIMNDDNIYTFGK